MARPQKKGLEYFRHYAKLQGKTMDTLQAEYGNDGYAFWFKLLEILAQQEDLSYDCNNAANWRYLASNAKISREKAEDIMDLLCDLTAIDAPLWKEKRVIWVQNLATSTEDVFKKRGTKTPIKPSFCDGNPTTPEVTDTESTQSKVNKSKVNIESNYSASAGACEGVSVLENQYSVFDIIEICKTECPAVYNRHLNNPTGDYELGQILDEVRTVMSLDEIRKLLKKANKTYISQPKYKTCTLIWVLNNPKKVLTADNLGEPPPQKADADEVDYNTEGVKV